MIKNYFNYFKISVRGSSTII